MSSESAILVVKNVTVLFEQLTKSRFQFPINDESAKTDDVTISCRSQVAQEHEIIRQRSLTTSLVDFLESPRNSE